MTRAVTLASARVDAARAVSYIEQLRHKLDGLGVLDESDADDLRAVAATIFDIANRHTKETP